jgi:hypothetical protein
MQVRSDPVPESFRLVTLYIVVFAGEVPLPDPATVVVPKPTAPGNTGNGDVCAKAFEENAVTERARRVRMNFLFMICALKILPTRSIKVGAHKQAGE